MNVTLGYAPPTGTNLQLVEVTGSAFIAGEFANLTHGRPVDLTFGAETYRYVANYYGGNGNDLVLEGWNRSIAVWGSNFFSQIGPEFPQKVVAPVVLENLGILAGKTVTAVAAGRALSVALCADGTLANWGATAESLSSPAAVKTTGALAGKRVAGISAASGHALAVCSDGSVIAWGDNSGGQLGNGSNTNPGSGLSPNHCSRHLPNTCWSFLPNQTAATRTGRLTTASRR